MSFNSQIARAKIRCGGSPTSRFCAIRLTAQSRTRQTATSAAAPDPVFDLERADAEAGVPQAPGTAERGSRHGPRRKLPAVKDRGPSYLWARGTFNTLEPPSSRV